MGKIKLLSAAFAWQLICLFFLSNSAHSKTFRFSTFDRGDGIKDIVSEAVVAEAYRRLGHNVDIIYLPGKRSLVHANSGNIDGELRRTLAIQKKFSNLIPVPVPIRSIEMCSLTYGKKNSFTDKELEKMDIAIVGGGTISMELGAKAKGTMEVTQISQIFDLVKFGRVDASITNCEVLKKYMLKNKIKGFYIQPVPNTKRKLYHFLHGKQHHLIPQITKVLKEMQDDGTIDRIYRKSHN